MDIEVGLREKMSFRVRSVPTDSGYGFEYGVTIEDKWFWRDLCILPKEPTEVECVDIAVLETCKWLKGLAQVIQTGGGSAKKAMEMKNAS